MSCEVCGEHGHEICGVICVLMRYVGRSYMAGICGEEVCSDEVCCKEGCGYEVF